VVGRTNIAAAVVCNQLFGVWVSCDKLALCQAHARRNRGTLLLLLWALNLYLFASHVSWVCACARSCAAWTECCQNHCHCASNKRPKVLPCPLGCCIASARFSKCGAKLLSLHGRNLAVGCASCRAVQAGTRLCIGQHAMFVVGRKAYIGKCQCHMHLCETGLDTPFAGAARLCVSSANAAGRCTHVQLQALCVAAVYHTLLVGLVASVCSAQMLALVQLCIGSASCVLRRNR
jgi:hypothetical protein